MSVQALSALYEQLLESTGLSIDSDGLVQMLSAEQRELPVRVDKRGLYVPNATTLRLYTAPDKKERYIAFHPLSESILRAQSPVIKWLRQWMIHRLQAVITGLLTELGEIAADTSRHKGLSPKATEFLAHVPDMDKKMVENLDLILDRLDGEKNRLINIYLKQGGNFEGKTAHRSAIVSFPFLAEFDDEENVVFGVKLRKKDRVTLKKFFLWLLPQAEDVNAYSYGSTSTTAPYFHALANSYINVASRLNAVTKIFAKHIPQSDELHINLNWAPDVFDLTPFRESLPPLSGNEGELNEDSKAGQRAAEFTQQQAKLPSNVAPSAPTTIQNTAIIPTSSPLVNAALTAAATINQAPNGRISEYKPLPTLGIASTDARATAVPGGAKPNNGEDLEQIIMARSMGVAFGGAAVPRQAMTTNFPWLPGFQSNVPMGGVPLAQTMQPGMMGGVVNLNALMPQQQMPMPGMMAVAPLYPNGTTVAPNLGGSISSI